MRRFPKRKSCHDVDTRILLLLLIVEFPCAGVQPGLRFAQPYINPVLSAWPIPAVPTRGKPSDVCALIVAEEGSFLGAFRRMGIHHSVANAGHPTSA